MTKPHAQELVRKAWQRLRGGELTPARAAFSVAVGIAVGVTPLWGLHWLILLAICVPLRLDAGLAWLAANVSLPFFAPFLTVAEIQIGARILHGEWIHVTLEEAKTVRPADVASVLVVGTALLAVGGGAFGGLVAFAIGRILRSRARRIADVANVVPDATSDP